MKPLYLFMLLPAAALAAGPFSAGLVVGLPLTDFVNTVQGTSSTVTNRYVVGPEAELNLPFGLGIELDALYRHFSYSNVIGSVGSALTTTGQGDWEFPLLLKYKLPSMIVRPYVEAGVAWDTLMGAANGIVDPLTNIRVATKGTTMGAVIGAGVDIHAVVIHIKPELRFTRWTSQHFNVANVLSSNQNQAEFLVGITF